MAGAIPDVIRTMALYTLSVIQARAQKPDRSADQGHQNDRDAQPRADLVTLLGGGAAAHGGSGWKVPSPRGIDARVAHSDHLPSVLEHIGRSVRPRRWEGGFVAPTTGCRQLRV